MKIETEGCQFGREILLARDVSFLLVQDAFRCGTRDVQINVPRGTLIFFFALRFKDSSTQKIIFSFFFGNYVRGSDPEIESKNSLLPLRLHILSKALFQLP